MRIIDLAATGRNIKRLRLEAGLTVRDLQEMRSFERIPCCKRIEKDTVVVYTEKQSGGHFQKSIVILRH